MSLSAILQTSVDLIGKLGPLCVAVAVYWANRQQTAWTNTVARRAAEVEDQKLRLALLERRLGAIQAIDQASEELQMRGSASPEAVGKVFEALRIAELVFGDEVRSALDGCLRLLLRWQSYDRARVHWRENKDDAKFQAIVAELFRIEEKFSVDMVDLRTMLLDAARVRQIPMASPPQRSSWRWSK